MPNVAIYARISSAREMKDPEMDRERGVKRQEQDCLALAEKLGLTVVATMIDNNVSAYTRAKKRQGWEDLKALISSGEIDGIVTWHTDRLYRHPADLEDILELLEGRELTIYSVTSGDMDLNTATGRMIARLLGGVARNEVEHKAERQARAHLEVAQQGRWQGGRVPIGYQRVEGRTGVLEIKPNEASALREAADRLLLGHSLRAVGAWFSAEIGRDVRANTLRTVLTGPTITGLRMHIPQGNRNKWASARSRRMVSGDLPAKYDVYEAQWEPILDRKLWQELRHRLAPDSGPGKNMTGKRPEKSLLGGLLRCECGATMGRAKQSYKCVPGGCGRVSISTRGVESLITFAVTERINRSNFEVDVPAAVQVSASRVPEDALRDKMGVYFRQFNNDQITAAQYEEQIEILQAQVARLRDAERAQAIEASKNRRLINAPAEWQALLDRDKTDETVEEIQATISEKRLFISTLMESISVAPSPKGKLAGPVMDPNRVTISWTKATKS